MRWILSATILAGLSSSPAVALAGNDKLMEFQVKDETYRGKVATLGKHDCWLLGRDGRLNQFRLVEVKRFRSVDSHFRPYRSAEMRDQLWAEFGREYDVAGTEHYLVCAPKGRAKQYAAVFEELYRTFRVYFGARGLRLTKPGFPLVAVVFKDQKSFVTYRQAEGLPVAAMLLGYYQPESNRVALFESAAARFSANPSRPTKLLAAGVRGPASERSPAFSEKPGFSALGFGEERDRPWPPLDLQQSTEFARGRGFGTIEAGLEETMIHEATHQVAFNTGVHSRIGENPRWVVEGLATVFEAEGVRHRNTTGAATPKSRINREQFISFQNFAQKRRSPDSLKAFIASDTFKDGSTLDFYGQAWAFTFFLVETRSRQYSRYLKRIAERDPLQRYTAKQRVADFQSAFGDDLTQLETEFLRYMDRLK